MAEDVLQLPWAYFHITVLDDRPTQSALHLERMKKSSTTSWFVQCRVSSNVQPDGGGFMCLIHIKWRLAAVGGLWQDERWYRNVMKKEKNQTKHIGICHLRAASKRGWDFEEINSLQPKWLDTSLTLGIWADDTDPSPLGAILHTPGWPNYGRLTHSIQCNWELERLLLQVF